MRRALRAATVCAAFTALTACSTMSQPSGGPSVTPSPSVLATSAAPPTASPTATSAAPTQSSKAGGINDTCMTNLEFEEKVLAKDAEGDLVAAMRGEGNTAVVLLHQTNKNGMCVWIPRVEWLEEQKVRMVMFDLCGYGRSTCKQLTWEEQVAAAMAWARQSGSQRIVLIGVSLGGAVAVKVGPTVKADAVVSLSGPTLFEPADLTKDAPRLRVPSLFVYSPDDAADLAAAMKALPQVPTAKKTVVQAERGHGYETLRSAKVREVVAAWIAGKYPA